MSSVSIIGAPYWTRQPQTPVEIDWSNPLTVGLVYCVMNGVELVSRRNIPSSKPGRVFSAGAARGPCVGYTASTQFPFRISGDAFTVDQLAYKADAQNCRSLVTTSGDRWNGIYLDAFALSLRASNTDFQSRIATVSGGPASNAATYIQGRATVSADSYEVWVDGVAKSLTLSGTAQTSFATTSGGITQTYAGASSTAIARRWHRLLSDAELQSLAANPWQIFTPLPRRVFAMPSAGGSTIIDLTAASFGFTGSAQQPSLRTELTRPSLNFNANSIQPKTTVGLAAGALNFTANAITVGGQTIIELTQAAFNFTANTVTLIKDTVIQLTTAAFNFVANAINVSTPPLSGSGSGGGMFMALAGLFKKRRYRQKIGKNE